MTDTVQLSAGELQRLMQNSKKQKQNVDDALQVGEQAVRAADAGWQSSAFDTFKSKWAQDKGQLTKLSDELGKWIKQLGDHEQVARAVNKPF